MFTDAPWIVIGIVGQPVGGGEPESILARLKQGLSLILPLRTGEINIGVILVLGLPDDHHAPSIVKMQETLSGIVALVLRNSILLEAQNKNIDDLTRIQEDLKRHKDHLEELVAERTADLEMGNEELKQEITERKRAEKALHKSEERYRRITEAVSDYLYTVSVEAGRAVETIHSEACCAVTGYTSQEFYANPSLWIQMVIDEDHETVLQQAEDILSGRCPQPIEHRIIRKDGTVRWVESALVPNYDASGNLISYDGIVCDITERRQAEDALRTAHDELETKVSERTRELSEANEKLKELDRLKSMFIASMSHELRTPLNSIIGFSGMILQDMAGDISPELRDYIGRVNRSGKHLLDMITDVIDISKLESGMISVVPEDFQLDILVREAIDNLAVQVKRKGLAIKSRVPEGLRMYTDRRSLLQCILNLLSNAVKFTEKGWVNIIAKEYNNNVEISISDTGIGIAKEDIQKIFASSEKFMGDFR